MPTTSTVPYDQLLAAAHELADVAAKAVMPYFRRSIDVENKLDGGFDPVTAADRAAEKAIDKALSRLLPDHGIVGEEFGTRKGAGRYEWIIDPIDGTRAFIMGSPLWGTLIGLLDEGEPILGLMSQPFTGERYWSARRASYLGEPGAKDKRIRTRICPRLADAIFTTTQPEMFATAKEKRGLEAVKSKVRMTRYGGDCYGYCLLAAGFVDVVIELGLKPHDIIALIPIVERAGGRITNWEGEPANAGGRVVVTGDPRLHDEVLALLRS